MTSRPCAFYKTSALPGGEYSYSTNGSSSSNTSRQKRHRRPRRYTWLVERPLHGSSSSATNFGGRSSPSHSPRFCPCKDTWRKATTSSHGETRLYQTPRRCRLSRACSSSSARSERSMRCGRASTAILRKCSRVQGLGGRRCRAYMKTWSIPRTLLS